MAVEQQANMAATAMAAEVMVAEAVEISIYSPSTI
jgi:hypothetical protein